MTTTDLPMTTDQPMTTTDDLDALLGELMSAGAHTVTLPDGEVLCRQGDPADSWWFVDEGRADVTIDGVVVGSVGAGETVGEVAVLDGRPRTATVISRGGMTVRVASAEDLHDAVAASPESGAALARLLVRRLRETNERTMSRLDAVDIEEDRD